MADLGNQLINQSYQNLLQITSSNAVQKGNGQAVNALAITSSTTSDIAPAITNNTNNRVLTATGGGTINGEANLTFNGSDLNVTGNVTAGSTVDTTNLSVNGYVNTDLSPTDATYNLTLGESTRTWNQVHVGTSDGTKTAFFGEDILNNPGKIAIRTDNDLIIRGQGIDIIGTTTINTLQNDTLTNNVSISTPSLTATNLRATNSASIGGNFVPQARLHISGANADALFRVSSPTNQNILFVSGSGRVGIGTTTPTQPVEIVNASTPQLRIRDGVSGGNLDLDSNGSGQVKITFASNGLIEAAGSALRIAGTTTNGVRLDTDQLARPIDLRPGGTSKLFVSASGVGLGTSNPLSQLHISASSGNEFLRITSGSQNILNIRSGSAVFFAGTGVSPTAGFDLDIQGTGTANGGTVRIAGAGTTFEFKETSLVQRTSTGNTEMLGMVMSGTGGTTTAVIQNPLRVQFDANQNPTSGSGYIVLRLNATHATTAGTGSKLLQTWEFGGVQRSVVNITGSIGVGITRPSASVHISSSLGLAPILAIAPHHPLPTTNIPTGSFMVSASTPPKPFFWDGTTWNALY